MTAPRPVGGDGARAAARRELAKQEYHRDGPGVVQRVLDWIGRHLDHLFSGSGGGGGGGHALLVLLVVFLVVIVAIAVRAGVPRRNRRTDTAAVDPLAPQAAVDHRRRAAELTAAGRHDEALREWLRAAVATIEDRGVLLPRPGRTGAATAREAGAVLPGAAGDLTAATTASDEVWFGGRGATEADVAHARAAADAVRRERIGPRRSTPEGIAVPQ